ncbi:MAG TPA: hypothetical protein VN018_07105 [Brevundimonas sp.]|nr:hypothetical protein [Brevundimonas sp.]
MDKPSSLRVGVDVPWVTSWSAEAVTGAARCASVGGRPALIQDSRPGFGKPQYSRNHLVRQRLSVARMLCPMCGEPTPVDDRWTTTAKTHAAGWLRAQRAVVLPSSVADDQIVFDAGAIAPLHRACAKRSMALCPHLRSDPDLHLARFPARYLLLPLMAEPEGAGGGPSVIGFLQLCGVTPTIDRRWRTAA